jgi:hypothetical protein
MPYPYPRARGYPTSLVFAYRAVGYERVEPAIDANEAARQNVGLLPLAFCS